MQFTQEQKNSYLDKLAHRTQEGIWVTDMALMKHTEQLAKKKALLTITEGKLEKKEYKSARDGKNEKRQVEADKLSYEFVSNAPLFNPSNELGDDLQIIATKGNPSGMRA